MDLLALERPYLLLPIEVIGQCYETLKKTVFIVVVRLSAGLDLVLAHFLTIFPEIRRRTFNDPTIFLMPTNDCMTEVFDCSLISHVV